MARGVPSLAGLWLAGLAALPAHAQQAQPEHPVVAGLELELYGYVKVDAAWDSARTSVGNFARWVESEQQNGGDEQFSLTAKQTRLGLKLRDPRERALRTSGRVEIDFYGSGPENKPGACLRHAYLLLEWPDDGWQLLAGQTSDVISPGCLPTINYTVGWWQGNIGYRRPQVRATRELALGGETELVLELAAARSVTGRPAPFGPGEGDTGQDSGFPTVQQRTSLSFPLSGERRATLGLSGHYGQEQQDTTAAGASRHLETWSVDLDLALPLGNELTLRGEAFTGENLDAYLGGIGQGLDGEREIGSVGGWLAATWEPSRELELNLGGSLEELDDDDLSTGTSWRTRNLVVFVNAWRALDEHVRLGLELSHLRTDYSDRAEGDSLRVQAALTYGI